jgi:hypothetical protein
MKRSVYFQNTLFVKDSDLGLRLCVSCELFSAGITKVHLNRNFVTSALNGYYTTVFIGSNKCTILIQHLSRVCH